MTNTKTRVYKNQGNPPLVALLPRDFYQILDVGCGAGDNAALMKRDCPSCRIFGITGSTREAELARQYMVDCFVFDIEGPIPNDLSLPMFDVLVFSHVLEHLREPAKVLSKFLKYLVEDGEVLIAVPNILSWRQRLQFLVGRFDYQAS